MYFYMNIFQYFYTFFILRFLHWVYAAPSLAQFLLSKPSDDREADIITALISKLKAAAPRQIPTPLSQIHFLCFAPVPNARSWQRSLCDVANACIFLCLRSRSCNISVPSAGAPNGLSVVKLTGFLLRRAAVDTQTHVRAHLTLEVRPE